MFKENRNLLVIAIIAIVNALGYGIIIPILYSYSRHYGLNDFQNGLLFSTFSICQFLATPFIGRLSDQHGRRPLLLISLTGTMFSFLMMAFAPNAWFLYLARALDGITAGNIPVASAVISDTTAVKDRARGFGIIAASFGFGFIFGPAISALTLPLGAYVPFLVAAVVTFTAIILTFLILPETNKHLGEVTHSRLFDFGKLFGMLRDPNVGMTLAISLCYFLAFGLFIYAFQPFATKILNLSAVQISASFTLFGIVGLFAQLVLVPRVSRLLGDRKALTLALTGVTGTFLGMFLVRDYFIFIAISIMHSLANAFVGPLIQTMLSQEVDAKSQGSILGINSSYMSLGLIFGPIIGGTLATLAIPLPFLAGSLLVLVSVFLSWKILAQPRAKAHAF